MTTKQLTIIQTGGTVFVGLAIALAGLGSAIANGPDTGPASDWQTTALFSAAAIFGLVGLVTSIVASTLKQSRD